MSLIVCISLQAKADSSLLEHANTMQELQSALEESAVIEQELRGNLERERFAEATLLAKNETLKEELARQHENLAAVKTQVPEFVCNYGRQACKCRRRELCKCLMSISVSGTGCSLREGHFMHYYF